MFLCVIILTQNGLRLVHGLKYSCHSCLTRNFKVDRGRKTKLRCDEW